MVVVDSLPAMAYNHPSDLVYLTYLRKREILRMRSAGIRVWYDKARYVTDDMYLAFVEPCIKEALEGHWARPSCWADLPSVDYLIKMFGRD